MRRNFPLRHGQRAVADSRFVEMLEPRRLLAVWAAVPTILKVSDAVEGGNSFTINGGGIDPNVLDVAIVPDSTGSSPATPPVDAVHPQIVQKDLTKPDADNDGSYVVVRMPGGAAPGVYNLWVKNGIGWSSASKLNAARLSFMSDYQAYNGIKIEVVGRNLDQSEFGGATATLVRLNNGAGQLINQSIFSLNPYNVTFTVNGTVGTDYFVEVSNDNGVNWAWLDNGQKLSIVANTGTDPLNLGVTWAQDFRWNTVYNVTQSPYNVNPADTGGDDTTAIQNAVNAAESAGGGVVYLPNGNYYVRRIDLGAGVVIQGQDKLNTRVYYIGTGGSSFVKSRGNGSLGGIAQLQGIARLSVFLSDPNTINLRPDVFFNLGDTSISASDQTLRTANRLFVANVNLSYPYNIGDSSATAARRGIGFLATGKERLLLQNNTFVGWSACNTGTYVSKYFTLKNNYYEFSAGYVHGTSTFSFYENNTVIIHPEFNQDSHGLFGRSDAYMADNYVQGAGDASNVANDGEAIAVEMPNGNFNWGAVTSATSTAMTVSTIQPLVNPILNYGDLSVVITNGRGIGQLRKVSVDVATSTLNIVSDKPFDIIPDNTSKFTLIAPLKNFTVYHNTIEDNAKGIWAYGNSFDDVIADNTTIDSSGVFLFTVRSNTSTSPGRDNPGYFVRMTRNSVTGVSRRNNCAGIGLYTARFGTGNTSFYDVMAYGTEITQNTIVGNNTLTPGPGGIESGPYSGVFIVSYGYSNQSDGTGTGDATDTIVEGNHLSNLKVGITLTRSDYGQVISRNTFGNDVLQVINDAWIGSDNTTITTDGSEQIANQGTIIASVTAPTGGGNHNIEVIRDGVKPPVGNTNSSLQYDTFNNNAGPASQFYGYTYSGNRTFTQLLFQEGKHFSDGGWFASGSLKVQVRQSGVWVDAALTSSANYPVGTALAAFGQSFNTYTFLLNNVVGDGIRIFGTAGGSNRYVSIGELEVWAIPTSITGTSADDSIRLVRRGANLDVYLNNTAITPTWSVLYSNLGALTINTLGGNDSVTLDYTNGSPIPSAGLTIAGGADNDTLKLIGTTNADTATFNASSIAFNGTITHGDIESIQFDGAGGNDNLTINAGPTVQFTATQRLAALTMAAGTTLDLNDNDLILDYSGATPLPTIESLISSARNGGTWTGVGITSTAAKNSASHNTSLGLMEASDYLNISGPGATFTGQPLDSTMVLIKYTYNGDTDFNGTVNFDDYSRIDLGFNTQSTPGYAFKWLVGDFDFNNSINFDDYSLIDLAFNTQGVPL